MEKSAMKHKHFRKFKRRAAALAVGAALMTGAFSGIPPKAQAAETPLPVPPAKVQPTTKDFRPPGHGWHQHKYDWPSPDENQALYQDGKIYYRSDNREHTYTLNNPIDYVKNSASVYGFDASLDDFTLLTVTRHSALVEVRQHDTGKLFNVLLKRTFDHEWTIVDVHAI